MRKLATLLGSLPFVLFAQTTWSVEAGGSLSDPNNLPYYDPMDLVIEVGDIVEWTNVEGTHNVYGQLDMFPDNPEGFGSGQPAQAPWTFSHTFNIVGVYEYHCTVEFQGQMHSTTQHGMITVVNANTVEEVTPWGEMLLFPVPANDVVNVTITEPVQVTAYVYGIDGRLLMQQTGAPSSVISMDMSAWPSGRYILRLMDDQGRTFVRPFVKQ